MEGNVLNLKQTITLAIEVKNMHDREFMANRMNDRRMENNSMNNSYTHSIVPMTKLEIHMFDSKNPRW